MSTEAFRRLVSLVASPCIPSLQSASVCLPDLRKVSRLLGGRHDGVGLVRPMRFVDFHDED